MLQGWQRVFRKIGERALRLRLFLVFRDVLLMVSDHRLYDLRSPNILPNGVGHVTVRCGLAAE